MITRNEGGQIRIQYPDSQFIEAVSMLHRATASEIAARVGCNARVATIRLKRLVAEGVINSSRVSGRWIFWK